MLRAPWRIVTAGRLLAVGLLLLVTVAALWAIPSHEYIFLPDRAHPVAPLVKVAGGHEPQNGGGIYFVDVIVRKASLLERLFGGLHDGASLYPASQIIPKGLNEAKQRQLDLDEMRLSQQTAAAVAMHSLGTKVPRVDTGARVFSVDAHGVGGPSAGLAFALEILEQLGRNVDHGHKIAATGEIWPNGSVHPIGGIEQKTIGARAAGVDAFLVPAGENARDARKYAKGLRIIPVKSFQQALHALATLPADP